MKRGIQHRSKCIYVCWNLRCYWNEAVFAWIWISPNWPPCYPLQTNNLLTNFESVHFLPAIFFHYENSLKSFFAFQIQSQVMDWNCCQWFNYRILYASENRIMIENWFSKPNDKYLPFWKICGLANGNGCVHWNHVLLPCVLRPMANNSFDTWVCIFLISFDSWHEFWVVHKKFTM